MNGKVNKFATFIKERGNPFLVSSTTKIDRFPSGKIVNKEDAARILDIIQNGQKKNILFCKLNQKQ